MLGKNPLDLCTECAYTAWVSFEWDPDKAAANLEKHEVHFSESLPVFDDDLAITIADDESDPAEQRFVSLGMGVKGRLLVVVYAWRGKSIRIISARKAEPHERAAYGEHR